MPTAEANGLLDNALETDEDRFGAVVAGDDDLRVTWQYGELLLAALAERDVVVVHRGVSAIGMNYSAVQ